MAIAVALPDPLHPPQVLGKRTRTDAEESTLKDDLHSPLHQVRQSNLAWKSQSQSMAVDMYQY